ncbi:MAG: hypothetical protein JW829_03730 [Pirellulales bacterium]|nr:hypothetical protein [Pirellulales bacterium]
MSDYKDLRNRLESTPCLVADLQSGQVELANQAKASIAMATQGPFPTKIVINVGQALETFSRLQNIGKDDREFTLREISEIAGMSYHLAYYYVKQGIFVPSVRKFRGKGRGAAHEGRFSWSDAFVAGVVGSLRRQGLRSEVLAKVPPLFGKQVKKKKRTRRKATTSDRS